MKRSVRVALLLGSLCAGGCMPLRPFTVPNEELAKLPARERERVLPWVMPCDEEAAADAPDCHLAILEFDDQGEFWHERQLPGVLDLIACKSRPDPAPDSDRERACPFGRSVEGQPAIVVAFVHGWKHNASPRDARRGNLVMFRRVLSQLAREEEVTWSRRGRAAGEPAPRPYVGVYMAWRGLSATSPLRKTLSFFGRKGAAERVGRVSFAHAIHRIVSWTKGAKSEDRSGVRRRGNPESVAIVVGHSFGGLILENTLLRSLTLETDDFEEDFPADVAVLVNPANEAILARQFVHALAGAPPRRHALETASAAVDVSMPVIVSVTSVGDAATGAIFPIGLGLKSLGKRFRRYEAAEEGRRGQRYYYTHTPGHTGEGGGLLSHRVTCPENAGGACRPAPQKPDVWLEALTAVRRRKGSEARDQLFDRPRVELGECARASERDAEPPVRCIEAVRFAGVQRPPGSAGMEQVSEQVYEIRRLGRESNATPYWIMQIPRGIVPNHSTIFQSEFVSLLAAFVRLARGDVEVVDAFSPPPQRPL